jgi:hypothetical protein
MTEAAQAAAWRESIEPAPAAPAVEAEAEVAPACALALQAYVAVSVGAAWSNGALHPAGLLLAIASLGLAGWAATWARRAGRARWPLSTIYIPLTVFPTLSTIMAAPGPCPAAFDYATRVIGLACIFLLGVHIGAGARWRRWALLIIVALVVAEQLLTPLCVPRPFIDVWQLYQYSSHYLLHGANPYTTPVPDIYEGGYDYGYTVAFFDYLPLNLLLGLPGYLLLGDYRFSLVAAFVGTVLLLRATGRRLGVAPRLVDALTLAFVLHPRATFIDAMGWGEGLLVLLLAAFVYLQVRWPGGWAQAVAFCALPALKQYLLSPVLLYLATVRPRLRTLLVGAAVAAATLVPFLLWDWRATVEYGVLFVVRRTTFRADSLSIPALLYHFTHAPCTKLPAVLAQVVVGAAAYGMLRRRGLGGYLLASGLALLASFLAGSQAFLNYYYLVGAFLLFAALALGAPSAADEADLTPLVQAAAARLRVAFVHARTAIAAVLRPAEEAPGEAGVHARSAVTFHAYILLVGGSVVGPGMMPHLGLPLMLAAVVLAWMAGGRIAAAATRPDRWLYAGLSGLAIVPCFAPPASPSPAAYAVAVRLCALVTVALLGVHAGGGPRARRLALLGIVVPALALQLVTPLLVPHPAIDVWAQTQFCTRELLGGVHPYTVPPPDIYGGAYDYGYHTNVYPYLPLNLLIAAPFVALLGDYRYALAVAAVAAVLLLRAAGRRLRVAPRLLDLITLALVLHPRAAYIVGMGWTEPLLIALLAAFVYFEVRSPGGYAQAIAFFLLPALKQYVVAPVALYLARRPRPRVVITAATVAAATLAPFLVWHFHATVAGAMFAFRHTSFRDDSLSITALLARFAGWRAPKLLGVLAQLAVAVPAFLHTRRLGVGGLLLASALTLCATFLFGSQAFMNYYYFVAALVLFAALCFGAREGGVA